MREIKPQSEALGALQALSKTESGEGDTEQWQTWISGDGSCCQSGVTLGRTCPGALRAEGWVGRLARQSPAVDVLVKGWWRPMLLEQQTGKRCFNTTLLGKATRMDAAWAQQFSKPGPANCEKGGIFFFPLHIK